MRKITAFVLILFLFIQVGCYRTLYRVDDTTTRVILNRPDPNNEAYKGHFEEKIWNHYFLLALVPTSKPNLSKIINSKVPPDCQVRNLRIRHEMTFINGLVSFIAGLGIFYSPMTTTIEGDIVKVNE